MGLTSEVPDLPMPPGANPNNRPVTPRPPDVIHLGPPAQADRPTASPAATPEITVPLNPRQTQPVRPEVVHVGRRQGEAPLPENAPAGSDTPFSMPPGWGKVFKPNEQQAPSGPIPTFVPPEVTPPPGPTPRPESIPVAPTRPTEAPPPATYPAPTPRPESPTPMPTERVQESSLWLKRRDENGVEYYDIRIDPDSPDASQQLEQVVKQWSEYAQSSSMDSQARINEWYSFHEAWYVKAFDVYKRKFQKEDETIGRAGDSPSQRAADAVKDLERLTEQARKELENPLDEMGIDSEGRINLILRTEAHLLRRFGVKRYEELPPDAQKALDAVTEYLGGNRILSILAEEYSDQGQRNNSTEMPLPPDEFSDLFKGPPASSDDTKA